MKRQALLTGIACGFILNAAFVLADFISHYKPPIPRQATWTYPVIEDCGLSTWDEIRGECSE